MGEFLFPMSLLGQVSGDDTNSLEIAFSHGTKRKTKRQDFLSIFATPPVALHLLRFLLNSLHQGIQARTVDRLYDRAQGRANQLFQRYVQHAGEMLVGKKH